MAAQVSAPPALAARGNALATLAAARASLGAALSQKVLI